MQLTLALVGALATIGVAFALVFGRGLRFVRRALHPAFGAWTMSSGSARRSLRPPCAHLSLGSTHYLPRFLGRDPTSLALTHTAVPISVVEAAATCRRNGLRCELQDLDGRVVAVIDEHGRIGR
ncbi:Hypothetical protein A7982_10226 [Minicystis rosea]|nr:Hypothetical protein A7982_10226 [Minicystis rosea]